ncbi:GPI ethanolamine phosphate transferase 2 isoform X2 [Silene latifolia]|uniref:GPI ethanolamine phosphate transferase 2 isoform X2 n=3 Tax=Silene latifolia TaxID=37657 RepID=UPI003D7865C3
MAAKTMNCSKLTIWTLFAIALQLTGLTLFVLGFFPVKPALSGISGPESYRSPGNQSLEDYDVSVMSPLQLRSLFQDLSQIRPSYSRIILMVVDGLPAEFVLGKDGKRPSEAFVRAMPYTQSLLANKMAIGYHSKAAPPTVTMPRLKAMVSGAVGGFLDVAFNFNTQAFLDDNLLRQLFRIGWNMSMLGDETWLKLFPGLFFRQDGVSSFFVKDTIQVDHNVSRHLPVELYKDDWNLLILHYLGVDHVGHIGGRKSALMPQKLKEMDDVIKMIHLNCILSPDNEQGDTLLLVVSDHGMTDSGNHGGSSYEETDALALFIAPRFEVSGDCASEKQDCAKQVDIAPTLALLLGVPIPKNNVGVLAMGVLHTLTDSERLRALELNSWQLLRLLKAQLPHLSCVESNFESHEDSGWSQVTQCSSITEEMFCCLYSKAAVLHSSWKYKTSRANNDLYNNTVTAYDKFMTTASDWLTGRVTEKPFGQLVLGMLAMVLSSLIFMRLLFYLRMEEDRQWNQGVVGLRDVHNLRFEEFFVVAVIVILVVSMGSSSMVEEEQYIWHYMTSTLFWILMRKTMKFLPGVVQKSYKGNVRSRFLQMWSILVVLVSGRILRAWHQGGVNWTYLPDISKWLELAGNEWIKMIEVVSGIFVTSLSLFAFSGSRLSKSVILVVRFFILVSGSLVLLHVIKYEGNIFVASNHGATSIVQIIYTLLSTATCIAVLASPWLFSVSSLGESCASKQISGHLRAGLKESSYLIGWVYMLSWSMLQLLLQQPINSMPVVLLLLQICASMIYFVNNEECRKPWVEVASLYFLGMAGHFGLGNSNTLATIDVAGAFIGISSHSTLLSGILMFCITYASPMLVLLSLVMYISLKDGSYSGADETLEFGALLKSVLAIPLLVPLAINSVLLIAYTVILLLMRNHLFIWSVFSPKYMYVCATTACVYIGVSIVAATEIYICLVYTLHTKRLFSIRNAVEKT